MKNKETIRRLAGLTSALAVLAGTLMPAVADELPNRTDYSTEKKVNVIVKLKGDPILGNCGSMGTDYLDTQAAENRRIQLENERMNVFAAVQMLYPDAEMEFAYDSVFNGFSCTVPESLTDDIGRMYNVEDVVESGMTLVPQLDVANPEGGLDTFLEDTELTGEGKVIAVIDTELNLDHEMFAPLADDIETKLSYEDVVNVINTKGLSHDIDPEKAFRNSKVPFAVNYADEEKMYSVQTNSYMLYHGTHVSGIAAGNRVEHDGKTLHGAAPDAQLIFFKSARNGEKPSIYESAVIAGVEDAVKLGADVINMSFGSATQSPKEYDIYNEVFDTAVDAGVMIVASAGNSGTAKHMPENPDTCTIGSPALMDSAFSVAAGYAYLDAVTKMELPDGTKLPYTRLSYSDDSLTGEYDYEYCGMAKDFDYRNYTDELKGKLIILDFEGCTEPERACYYASAAGAAGIIFPGTVEEALKFNLTSHIIHYLIVDREYTDTLKNAEKKHINFDVPIEYLGTETGLCEFTSSGIPENFEIKPEIAGYGALTSASNRANDAYEYMQGTSMSSPYVAGCAALTSCWLDKNGISLSGAEKIQMMKNVMMNSATPLKIEDVYQSPRKQGAGMVNMANLEDTKVILTGSDGKACISQGEIDGNSFSFDVTMKNISDDTVFFTNASAEFTTDKIDEEDGIHIGYAPEKVITTADMPDDMLAIEAGEERKFTITVDIDEEYAAAKDEVFKNGWFVDGYVSLSGSVQCCDISIPIVGFRGDWYSLPMVSCELNADPSNGKHSYMFSDILGTPVPSCISLAELIRAQLMLNEDYSENTDEVLSACTDACRDAARYEYCYSPNWDGMADDMNYRYGVLRDAQVSYIDVIDKDGNVVVHTPDSIIANASNNDIGYIVEVPIDDGEYTAKYETKLCTENAGERKQSYEFGFCVDSTDPKISDVKLTEKNGRKILSFKASDERLDGIYIIGNGKGGVPGALDDKKPTARLLTDAMYIFNPLPSYTILETQKDDKFTKSTPAYLDDYIEANANNGSDICKDFFDVAAASCDENGEMVFEYDVTDLTDYTITVADRAFNMAKYSPDAPFVHSVADNITVKTGDKLMPADIPEIECAGKITEQGWEMLLPEGEWKPIDSKTKADAWCNNALIRYYAVSGGNKSTSNNMRVKVEDAYRMDMEVCVDDELNYSAAVTAQHHTFHLGYAEKEFRIELTSEGYIPRTITFKPDDELTTDLYLCKKGDVNGDGVINVTDVSKAAAHIKAVKKIGSYEQKVADVNGNGSLNVTDISMLAAKVKGVKNF
ncbi:S8 family serine peptidase [Ruminococcus albus]|uniref:Dockerin domain-containing protein n=1 Tax=Ruminococcus albus 8 TaxID=246199 RepID=E9S917_RUMAL|nr:S8 family serine peptidase [Ruminococcus albus]EGC04205.1 hypothetical protein CUS_5533 [Ruminococcus albus 8]MCC3350911.1 S8 family serine peptidase [Ruminococcus albus 8]